MSKNSTNQTAELSAGSMVRLITQHMQSLLNINYKASHELCSLIASSATTSFFTLIEKQWSHCNALEHLESSGANILIMDLLYPSYGENREVQKHISLKMYFHTILEDELQGVFSHTFNIFLALPVYYLSKGFKAHLEFF